MVIPEQIVEGPGGLQAKSRGTHVLGKEASTQSSTRETADS